jgi:hypothetical protein
MRFIIVVITHSVKINFFFIFYFFSDRKLKTLQNGFLEECVYVEKNRF